LIDIHAFFRQVIWYIIGMVEISYRVIPGAAGGFDVQMGKPNGPSKTATGFGSEHEADAWIIQTKRMKRDAAPWTPLAPRKSGATAVPQRVTAVPLGVGDESLDRSASKP
jgi:hypothetical protein